ncbi:MAG: DNA mismatch repair protein MutS [Labilithrix sp.]|nr:DNA mismatch repair protein MutS [Labilithrix sp.]MCW5816349.1 DNA mismatch repair protein MutS [Labilithrix sp.]
MKSPRETHEAALAARKANAETLEGKANAIGNARLVAALGAIGLVIAIAFANVPRETWLGVVACVIAFGALVVVHARIHAEKDRAAAAMRFHERALDRMSGKWRAFPQTGARWAVPTHPYAGDLDVFGRASLFQRIDVTSTRYGEEILARWLSGDDRPQGSNADFALAVEKRQAAVKDLAPRLTLREQLAAVGALLDDKDQKPDPRPFVMWAGQTGSKAGEAKLPGGIAIVAALVPATTIGLAVAGGMGLVHRMLFLLPFVVSVAVLNALRPRIQPALEAASSKESALSRYGDMLKLLEDEKFEADVLLGLQKRLAESGSRATEEMSALSRIVGFVDARNNEVFRFFIGPALMWDLWCALALEKWRARAGKAAFSWFRSLAELEALASIAGFAFENPDYAFPSFQKGEDEGEAVFVATSLGHPLIDADKRVSNDVTLAGPGHALVVTGSNMSGKSTLLRAIGTNAVLANAGAPVCAKELTIGRLEVATSMRVSDSLEEGTSRFYAELKKLKLVLDLSKAIAKGERPGTLLFLLDEILHGTNTRERLIGARAIMKELLARRAMGAVSTHDLGLGDLETELAGDVKNVHFEEQVEGEVMSFDYKLRQGVVQSSNALRLMKIVGLDVVA